MTNYFFKVINFCNIIFIFKKNLKFNLFCKKIIFFYFFNIFSIFSLSIFYMIYNEKYECVTYLKYIIFVFSIYYIYRKFYINFFLQYEIF